MASTRAFSLRQTLSEFHTVSLHQRRWARVHDIRFLATISPSGKVYEKYKDKLDRKVKEIGVNSIDDLKKIYKDSAASRASAKTSAFPPPPPPPSAVGSEDNISSTPSSQSKAPLKTLASFFDLDKVSTLSAEDISTLWRIQHEPNPQSVCAIIPTSIWRKLETTAKRHPQFILPIAREVKPEHLPDGAPSNANTAAEIHFLQWTFPAENTVTVLFTHLAEYKLRGEFAQAHTTVTHHLELAESKGLVLLQGEVQKGRGMSVEDGRWLLMCLQKFYGMGERVERKKLLKQFSEGDQEFKVEELVSEAERLI